MDGMGLPARPHRMAINGEREAPLTRFCHRRCLSVSSLLSLRSLRAFFALDVVVVVVVVSLVDGTHTHTNA